MPEVTADDILNQFFQVYTATRAIYAAIFAIYTAIGQQAEKIHVKNSAFHPAAYIILKTISQDCFAETKAAKPPARGEGRLREWGMSVG